MTIQLRHLLLAIFLIGSPFFSVSSATSAQVSQDSAQVSQDGDSPRAPSAASASRLDGVDLFTSRIPSESYDRVWQMTGPFGGDVTAMAIDPRDADRIWLGASDGHIFRSTDGGNVWRRIRPGIKSPGFVITVILFDSERPGTIYVGLKPLLDLNDETSGGGVYVSEDDGQTWRMLEAIRGRSVRNMAQAAKDANVLAVAARDGLYLTSDRGRTWNRITPANDPEFKGFHSVAIDPRDANVIYVGTHHLPWKTTDSGKTWKLAGSKERGMIDDSDIMAIHIDESNPDIVLMSACSGIYRSHDASATWSKIQGIPYSSRRTHVIYQHPTRPEVIFAGTTEGLWLSTDSGKPDSWRRMTSVRTVINTIAIHPARPDRIFLGTEDNGVLISLDGGESYEASNAGFINRQVRAVLADRTERGRVYAGVIFDGVNSGMFISEDGGITWSQSMSGMGVRDVYSIYQSESNPATIYAGTNHGLFRSDDHGRSWAQVKKEGAAPGGKTTASEKSPADPALRTPPKSVSKARAKSRSRKVAAARPKRAKPQPPKPKTDELVDLRSQVFAILPLKPFTAVSSEGEGDSQAQPTQSDQSPEAVWMIASTWDGLFRTENEKKGWREIRFPRERDGATRLKINTVVTNPHMPGSIFIGTDEGLFISRDNGESFNPMPLDEEIHRIRCVVFDPRSAETIYVGASNGFFRSFDGGRTWENRGGGMPLLTDVGAILISATNPDELHVNDQLRGALYHSKDRGQNWERVDISQLPSLRIWSLVSDPFDPAKIYAGSFSGGVYVMSRK